MFIRARLITTVLLAGLAPAAFAGLVSVPGLGDPVFSEADVQNAFAQGRATGRQESAAECIGDPANCGCGDSLNPCGISLSSVLNGAQFGETEPNDHMVAADGLIPQHIYWGQSRELGDEDWYYLTTVEPNQLLTLNFTVPERVLTDNTRLSQGWMVQVRDAAGNIYAQFDTRFALDDTTTANKNESREITYPVFLGHVGTYYIVVVPRLADSQGALITDPTGVDLNDLSILFFPYNLAAVVSFSGLDAPQPDVNFHDVEVEKNDDAMTANPLASGTSMFAFLHQNEIEAATGEIAGDEDWFSYSTPGNEQIVLSWCGKEACDETAIWTIEVRNPDGSQLLSTTTDKAETLRFALGPAGTYYLRVRYQVKTDVFCAERSTTEIVCKADEELACFKDENNQYSDNTCSTARNLADDFTPAADTPPPNFAPPPACSDDGYEGHTDDEACYRGDANPVIWVEQTETTFCNAGVLAPDTGCNQDGVFPDLANSDDPLQGEAMFRSFQFQTVCRAGLEFKCLAFANEIDANALNVNYNFTWWGTKLLPLTNGSSAFDVFLERPGFYQDR